MHPAEVRACLDSMVILVDTREQPSKRAEKRYSQFESPHRVQKLNYGDYTYSFSLTDGADLFRPEEKVNGHAVVERKMNLEELSNCLCQGKDRFRREFERANEAGASIYLLVENASWEKLLNWRYKTKFHPNAFVASLLAWQIRYGFRIIFCQEEVSGKMIKNILYRELKERLENGEYG